MSASSDGAGSSSNGAVVAAKLLVALVTVEMITISGSHALSDTLKLPGRQDFMTQCYGKYGCFSVDYPWISSHRVASLFPESPREIRPYFFLYTRHNPNSMRLLAEGDDHALANSPFDARKMTFLVTHGYMEHGRKNWLHKLKKELLKHGDHNVIIMDWLTGSGPPYTQATANTRMIGAMAAHFLMFLRTRHEAGLNLYRTHLIGHSLGAHLCGYIGSYLKKHSNLEIGRITGLDPAEPHFEGAHEVVRLDPSDGYFVDVIHTDSNPIMKFGLGMAQACGHLDFYPNGGKLMTGCDQDIFSSLAEENGNFAYAFRRLISCNHIRAYEYFTESINSECQFIAVACPSWKEFTEGKCNGCTSDGDPYACDYMGFYAFANSNGSRPMVKHAAASGSSFLPSSSRPAGRSLYLLTSEKRPFCAYHYRVTIVLSDTKESLRQGGDRGNFHMILNGDEGVSTRLHLNKEEAFFEPGRIYHFMTTTEKLGHIKSADLIWDYSFHPFNPITWRLLSESKVFVNRIEIEQFGTKHKHTFCAEDKPFPSGEAKRVVWKPTCRDNAPDPGSTFLGAVLNADPVGNVEFVFSQVNPLNMNPLNGLGNLGQMFRGVTAGILGMGGAIRRMGSSARRAFQTSPFDRRAGYTCTACS